MGETLQLRDTRPLYQFPVCPADKVERFDSRRKHGRVIDINSGYGAGLSLDFALQSRGLKVLSVCEHFDFALGFTQRKVSECLRCGRCGYAL